MQPVGRHANRRVFATCVGRDETLIPGASPKSNADGLVTDDDGRFYALTESGIDVEPNRTAPRYSNLVHHAALPEPGIRRTRKARALRGRWRHAAEDSMLTRGFQGRTK